MKHLFINRNTYILNTFAVLYCDDDNNHLEDSDDNDDVDDDDDNKLVRSYTSWERDVAQSIACPPLKRSVVGSILLSGPSCSLGYFPFQPVVHNWFIKGRGMYCSVYGKVHIKDPLLLIEKSSLCGGSGFPSKKCVNVTI